MKVIELPLGLDRLYLEVSYDYTVTTTVDEVVTLGIASQVHGLASVRGWNRGIDVLCGKIQIRHMCVLERCSLRDENEQLI